MAEPQAIEHATEQAMSVAAHGEAAGAAHPPELPNIIGVLHHAYPENHLLGTLYTYENQIFAFVIILLIALFFNAVAKRRSLIPGRLQAGVEMVFEALLDLISGILGEKEARRYFPFLGSLFIFIWCMNLFGLVPLMKSPTSSIYVTASLAVCVFFYVQFIAFTRLGPAKYFHHLMGEPKDVIGWAMVPLFLPLHVMEEFIKPLSLACRLFGNVYGEDILLGVGMVLGIGLMAAVSSPLGIPVLFGIPLHFPFMLLALLLSTIQAMVFTLLATVYFSMVMPHEEHHEHAGLESPTAH